MACSLLLVWTCPASGDSRFGGMKQTTNTRHEDDQNYFNGNEVRLGTSRLREFERAGGRCETGGSSSTCFRGDSRAGDSDVRHRI